MVLIAAAATVAVLAVITALTPRREAKPVRIRVRDDHRRR